MNYYDKFTGWMLRLSVWILLVFSFELLLANVGFMLGFSVSAVDLGAALCLVMVIMMAYYKSKSELLCSATSMLIIGVIAVIFATVTIDTTYDGCSYHKMAIGLLKNGWNPIYDSHKVFEKIGMYGEEHSLWINHYANGQWIISSIFYLVTGNIESGKAFAMLSYVALFGILNYYFSKKCEKRKVALTISILATLSPVICSQFTTYYIDGVLSVYIIMCIIMLLLISDRKIDISRNYAFTVLGMIIMIGGNIKFTGLGYMGFFCIFYYILWLINAYRQKIFKKTFRYCTIFYVIVLILTVGIAGFSSYVMNTVEKGNPLYPLIGKDKVDIMSFNQPEQFDNYNNAQKLFVSLFAETSDVSEKIDASEKIKLKIPLHVSVEEVKQCMRTSDIRLGGFGPLFSGMFVLMVILIIYGEYKLFKRNRYLTIQLIGIECIMAMLILCVDGGWWARYSGYSYILVACAMVIGYNMKRGKILDFIYKFLLTLTVINTFIMMLAIPRGIVYSQKQYKTLKMIKNRCDEEETSVNIAFQSDFFNGNIYNFIDYDIPFNIVEYDDSLEEFNEFCFYGFEK